ncbi:MAG TPA: hypothetical protein VM032_06515 [Vicinamibacterales bacterium]|nr:hypothetical protein [Vicinamibacterales bacterium]
MKMLRFGTTALLLLTISGAPAAAGELRDSVSAAAAAATEAQETPMKTTGGSTKAMLWGGTALFAGGMAYGLFEFINNKNGSYSEFGEAAATNKKAGAAGLSVAFAGGALMLIGRHAASMPSVTFGRAAVGVSKKVSW